MKSLTNSIKKSLKSFRYAFQGIKYLIKHENNFRYHMLAAIVAVSLGFYLSISTTEWLIIISMIGLVLMAEAFNTSLEKLMDILHPELHPKIGKAKDIAAGAVLIIAATAATIGIIIFAGRISL